MANRPARVNMVQFAWDTCSVKSLLDLWEENEILWKIKHQHYCNVAMKKDVYAKILRELNVIDDPKFRGLLAKVKKIKDQWNHYNHQAGADDIFGLRPTHFLILKKSQFSEFFFFSF